jgi:catechol 2,3-dioxygenase-like lactoylglutathione lyase family enzyme
MAVNCNFNHIALSVADLDTAVKWYSEIFGLRVIVPPMNVKRETATGVMSNIFDREHSCIVNHRRT